MWNERANERTTGPRTSEHGLTTRDTTQHKAPSLSSRPAGQPDRVLVSSRTEAAKCGKAQHPEPGTPERLPPPLPLGRPTSKARSPSNVDEAQVPE